MVTDKKYYMNETLKKNLDILKQKVKRDWYFIIIVSGSNRVRVGKSTLAKQIAYYLDPKYSFKNLTFEGPKIKDISLKLPKYSVIHFDEAKMGLDAKRAMESLNKDLLDFLSQAGQLNQYLILVLPDYFVLNREIATNQSICLINCYTHAKDLFKRGYFQFFNIYSKNKLFYWGKKQGGNYWAVKPDFKGDFTNYQVLDKKRYEDLKREALQNLKKADIYYKYARLKDRYFKTLNQRNNLAVDLVKRGLCTQVELANMFGMTTASMAMIMKGYLDKADKEQHEEEQIIKES